VHPTEQGLIAGCSLSALILALSLRVNQKKDTFKNIDPEQTSRAAMIPEK
jgi:hypothetical protein